jgi:ABC-type lipoprotein export system ATPase subunit
MTRAVVECEGLVHIYKTADLEVVALQGLDLEVAEGETLAIVGRSGSGKTTLMNILAGVEAPSAGTVRVAGNDLTRMREQDRERYRLDTVGYVWQHSQVNLWPELTAVENVQVPMVASRKGARDHFARARRLLEALELGGCEKMRPAQLSGGQNQRLALAVAMANQPALLLADEPTAELDGDTARNVLHDLVGLLREAGASAVMVTHDHAVEQFVDRVVQIRDGRTSTERRWIEREGAVVADETVIIDRAGRLQLPRAHVEKLGLTERVRVHLEDGSVRIFPVGLPVQPPVDQPAGKEEPPDA